MKINSLAALLLALLSFGSSAAVPAQSGSRSCAFDGAYRIDVDDSDRLYSVVRGATSKVPFGEQQQFFMDLSVRLTPPDILAIECRGSRVSVGSSRARKVTFIADGATRTERSPSGSVVRSKVAMTPDSLTFTSSGRAEDSVNVAFRALDGGRRLEVTRRINATQLSEPIVIRSLYNRISGGAVWDAAGEIAGTTDSEGTSTPRRTFSKPGPRPDVRRQGGEAEVLRTALDEWIGATNDRDISKQMSYYLPRLDAYYLSRNTPRSAVMSEKRRVFSTASSIDIRADEPEIVFQDAGRTAVMRFNKKYRVADKGRTKSGEVIQELRWRQTGDGWRIYSERDVRVIR
jgi:hypothetical protein